MANQSFTVSVPDVQLGPYWFWYNLLAPADGQRMLVDAQGNPQNPAAGTWQIATPYSVGQEIWDGTNVEICIGAGTSDGITPTWPAVGGNVTDGGVTWKNLGPPYSMGGTQGPVTFHAEMKLEEARADQETGPIDAIMTAESAYIETTLAESSLQKIAYGLASATYSTGTDAGFPASAQNYEQIDVGGWLGSPSVVVQPFAFPCVGFIARRRTLPNRYIAAILYSAYASEPHSIGYTLKKEAVFKIRFSGLAQQWRTQGKRIAQYWRML